MNKKSERLASKCLPYEYLLLRHTYDMERPVLETSQPQQEIHVRLGFSRTKVTKEAYHYCKFSQPTFSHATTNSTAPHLA